jgi:DNA-directed RNA polymerase specialized sigma24 family protein
MRNGKAMPEYINAPPEFDPQPHLLNAFSEIKNYTAIFILEDGRVCSGVFVNACGIDGILTANHVAEPVIASKDFAMCIAEHEHALWLKSEHFEHIPVGIMPKNPDERKDGPDLSFIIIRDAKLLGILRSLKSFVYLDKQRVEFFDSPLDRQLWAIAGSPYESKKILKNEFQKGGPLTKVANWVGFGHCQSRQIRNGFDFIEIDIWAGLDNYPQNYEGVSGGGFWIIPLEIDDNEDIKTVAHAKPLLSGIAFHQTDPPIANRRVITGHGFDSIYKVLRQKLNGRSGTGVRHQSKDCEGSWSSRRRFMKSDQATLPLSEQPEANAAFSKTQWITVLQAQSSSPKSHEALNQLCRRYWPPVYAFIRRKWTQHSPQKAEDLTQQFFVEFMRRFPTLELSASKGKFRTFLLTCLTRFLSKDWERSLSAHEVLIPPEEFAETVVLDELSADTLPERAFDHVWANTLVKRTLTALRQEYVSLGKGTLHERLLPLLTSRPADGAYATIAVELEMSEGALRVASHQFRRRFGELLRAEVANTVTRMEDTEDELQYLLSL